MESSKSTNWPRPPSAIILAAIGLLFACDAARAGFVITISEDSGAAFTKTVAHAPTGETTATLSAADLASLQTITPDFTYAGVSFVTSGGTAEYPAKLLTSGTFTEKVGGHTLHVTVTDNYTFPPGTSYTMNSSESGSYVNQSGSSSITFHNLANAASNAAFTETVSAPAGSFGHDDAPLNFTSSGGYTMTQSVDIAATAGSDFNFTVSSLTVPEPGSIALLGLGLAGAGLVGTGSRRARRGRARPRQVD